MSDNSSREQETGRTRGDAPVRLGLVGIGKIALDQHVPALRIDPGFVLAATASRNATLDGIPAHSSVEAMIGDAPRIDAVSLCTPPVGRHVAARAAIEAGLHVMLEKPPAATLCEAEDLARRARACGVTLFATWHSREAAGVEAARAWLADKRVRSVRIVWKEDIRRWHPGQDWILAEGGFGVFDPGINALSILTTLLAEPVFVETARLEVPANRASPIAARLAMRAGDTPITADFDFRQTGPQTWDILVETDAGPLRLSDGGATLAIGDAAPRTDPNREYPRLYTRFAHLIATSRSDVDLTPMRLAADAFLLGTRVTTAAFAF